MSNRFHEIQAEFEQVMARNAADYEAVAQMTGATVAEINADTTAADPGEASTWQLTGNEKYGAWTIHDAEDNFIATCYCDLATARLLCAAREMQEALEAVEWVGPDDTGYRWCEWCGNYNRGSFGHVPDCQRQRALRLAAGGTKEEER